MTAHRAMWGVYLTPLWAPLWWGAGAWSGSPAVLTSTQVVSLPAPFSLESRTMQAWQGAPDAHSVLKTSLGEHNLPSTCG